MEILNCLDIIYPNKSLSRFGNGNSKNSQYSKISENSTFLTPKIKQCLGIIYPHKNLSRFGGIKKLLEKDFINNNNNNNNK